MMIPRLISISCASCLALAASGVAQQPHQPQDPQRPDRAGTRGAGMQGMNAEWATLERILDASVHFAPAMDPARGGEDPARPPADDDATPKGEVENFITDARSGEIRWVVLTTGDLFDDEKKVAVPFDKLHRKPMMGEADEELDFVLQVPREHLRMLKPFDVDRPGDDDFDRAIQQLEQNWRELRDAGMDRPRGQGRDEPGRGHPDHPRGQGQDPGRDDPGRDEPGRDEPRRGQDEPHTGRGEPDRMGGMGRKFVLADNLKGVEVRTTGAGDGEFGNISTCIVDLKKGCVDFVVASEGGVLGIGETDYLIPFQAGRIITEKDDDDLLFTVQKSESEMQNAPKYRKPEGERAPPLDATQAKQAKEFFGLSHERGRPGK